MIDLSLPFLGSDTSQTPVSTYGSAFFSITLCYDNSNIFFSFLFWESILLPSPPTDRASGADAAMHAGVVILSRPHSRVKEEDEKL